ncbi:T-complex protein 1 subunit delta [Coemansia sp. RSA 2530]|nr:T-complex protein 1 subunit delta [Coemansia sp. RSA 2530]
MAATATAPSAKAPGSSAPRNRNDTFNQKDKPAQVRLSNITAAKAVADAIRTSLGPRGMDKMIETGKKEVVISNDGATILKHMSVLHPAARMLVDLSAAQDVEAGDGTTSVVVLAGSLLIAAEKLLKKGVHPTQIAEGFQYAAIEAVKILEEISIPINLDDREFLLKSATTSLSSKVVSQYSSVLAPIVVDSVLRIINPATDHNVDLNDIRIVKKIGGTIDDTELVPGLVLNQTAITSAGGPSRVEKAKIGLIQFQLSPPKPDMDNQVVVNDYRQMDRILPEERTYLLNLVKKIKKAGCNVLLIQKSILRDAVNSLSLHFLSKLKIMAIKEVERDEIEFLCKATGCKPIADIDSFTEDKLGYADLVEEAESNGSRIVQISGIKGAGKTASIIMRGANQYVLDEADRSIHDALCVIRCLVKKRALVVGGGAPEIEISQRLSELAKTQAGFQSICFQAFAEAVEVIPTTLAENSGLSPISIVTDLRNRHAKGEKSSGINVRKGTISDMLRENVVQPLLVSTSAIELSTETVRMLLKIDDILASR